jgi:BirA family biotin operon repressor/biotin-[acetyl-CoA-carboxylase] ligase
VTVADPSRALLARLCDGPASGAELARGLGVSRAAVWKRIEALRAAGADIAARPGVGYALARPLQLLDADALRSALSPAARAELASLDVLFETDSTNAEALRAPPPPRGTRVLLAERQTAGRGRRGRAWASPLGAHVYVSLSRRFDGGIAALQGLSLAVGIAIAQALHARGFRSVGLKWPNDLLADGRKLGGILVEVGGDAAGPMHAVVGVGLNIAMPPAAAAAIDQPWTDLASVAGTPASRHDVAVALLDALLPLLAAFERDGAGPLLAQWPRFDALAGQPVRVHEGGRTHDGIALGIAADGALRVRGDDGVERLVHAGEASLRAA